MGIFYTQLSTRPYLFYFVFLFLFAKISGHLFVRKNYNVSHPPGKSWSTIDRALQNGSQQFWRICPRRGPDVEIGRQRRRGAPEQPDVPTGSRAGPDFSTSGPSRGQIRTTRPRYAVQTL
jgi:hypothetical protein